MRDRPESGRARRSPLPPGRRRRRPGLGDPGDHRHRVSRGRRARPGDERLRLRLRRRRLHRAPGRRPAHPGAELALGLLRQHPDRRGHVRARPRAHPGGQRARARARSGLGRLGARHGVADERDLRDRRGDQPRLALTPRGRLRWPRRGAHGRLPHAGGPHRQPDHAAAHPPPARADRREPRPRLPRHRDVLDLLPRHALPGARPSLQRPPDRRGIPALDAHRRRARAGHHGTARTAVRAAARAHQRHGERRRAGCSCSPRSGRTPPSSRRSSWPASRSASASAPPSCRC